MARDKRSFFERLTGSVSADEYTDDFEEVEETPQRVASPIRSEKPEGWMEEEQSEGQLGVDVYQTPSEIIIRAVVAGVRPDDLDVAITRDMVTIRGKREETREVSDENYFYKELYWGGFSRTILLPQEVEVEGAQANEKHGLLVIRLPKIDKAKQTKLRVRTN